VNASISRLMSAIADQGHLDLASKLRDILSIYEKNSDLISIGAYKHGTNHKLDFAISKIDKINAFLKQGVNEKFTLEETVKQMEEILN